MTRVFRLLLSLHRWIGAAVCVLFLLWFPSGIGMMYWGMPSVTQRDRLARAPALDPDTIRLTPDEAAARVGERAAPEQTRLNAFDGRPVYRFGGGRGGGGGDVSIVYADTGDVQGTASRALRDRAAEAWTKRRVSDASVVPMTEPDQWTVGSQLRSLRPLWKYSWNNGEQLYIGESGEVLLHTTSRTRLQAYLSAIPHWLYFTPLRKHQPVWIRFATYSAMVGTAGVVIGMVLGVWLYSPERKYRHAGAPSRIPYKGQKRWHLILGLVFGVATFTWTLSGSLAFLPFPAPRPAPTARSVQPEAGQRRPGQGGGQRPAQNAQGPGRRGGDPSVAAALRGRVRMADFTLPPAEILRRHRSLGIRELTFSAFDSEPHYVALLADGTSRLIAADGRAIDGFAQERIVSIVRRAVPTSVTVDTTIVDEYDYYYLDRTRQRPLPVIKATLQDAAGTRYYIDPKSGTVVGTYSERNWARRFFYNGLHSLSFPWLYNHRPLWDIVVITFMVGGTALSFTSLVLAWRVLGRKLKGVVKASGTPRAARVPQTEMPRPEAIFSQPPAGEGGR